MNKKILIFAFVLFLPVALADVTIETDVGLNPVVSNTTFYLAQTHGFSSVQITDTVVYLNTTGYRYLSSAPVNITILEPITDCLGNLSGSTVPICIIEYAPVVTNYTVSVEWQANKSANVNFSVTATDINEDIDTKVLHVKKDDGIELNYTVAGDSHVLNVPQGTNFTYYWIINDSTRRYNQGYNTTYTDVSLWYDNPENGYNDLVNVSNAYDSDFNTFAYKSYTGSTLGSVFNFTSPFKGLNATGINISLEVELIDDTEPLSVPSKAYIGCAIAGDVSYNTVQYSEQNRNNNSYATTEPVCFNQTENMFYLSFISTVGYTFLYEIHTVIWTYETPDVYAFSVPTQTAYNLNVTDSISGQELSATVNITNSTLLWSSQATHPAQVVGVPGTYNLTIELDHYYPYSSFLTMPAASNTTLERKASNITVTVYDSTTFLPVSSATVNITNTTRSITDQGSTNSTGSYVSNLYQGNYYLNITGTGITTYQTPITIDDYNHSLTYYVFQTVSGTNQTTGTSTALYETDNGQNPHYAENLTSNTTRYIIAPLNSRISGANLTIKSITDVASGVNVSINGINISGVGMYPTSATVLPLQPDFLTSLLTLNESIPIHFRYDENTTLEWSLFFIEWTNRVNITILDEKTETPITWTNITVSVTNSNGDNRNYSSDTGNFIISGLPDGENEIRYLANGYTTRSYHYTATQNGTDEINLYMLNSSLGTLITYNIIDEGTQDVIGARLKALKYFESCNCYRQVVEQDTNFNGVSVLDLEAIEKWYKLLVTKDGQTLDIISDYNAAHRIYETSYTLQVKTFDSLTNSAGLLTDIYTNLQRTGGTWRLTYNDPNGRANQICLEVYQNYNLPTQTLLNSSCDTASSGVLIAGTNISSYGTYTGVASYSASPFKILDTLTYSYKQLAEGLGGLGVFMALMVILAIVGVSSWNPSVSLVMQVFGIAVFGIMGVWTVTLMLLVSLIVPIVIIIIKNRT